MHAIFINMQNTQTHRDVTVSAIAVIIRRSITHELCKNISYQWVKKRLNVETRRHFLYFCCIASKNKKKIYFKVQINT